LWLALLGFGIFGFTFDLFFPLDPELSKVQAPTFPNYSIVLTLHMTTGAIALIAGLLQVWPWFRGRFVRAHRIVGRLYVFAGVLPSACAVLVLGIATPYGPVARASSCTLAPLWFLITLTGWRMIRQGRYTDHRRWMLRSYALTFSTVTNRLWGPVLIVTLSPQFETTFGGNATLFMYVVAGATTWLGWTIPLLLVQAYLEFESSRGRGRLAPTTSLKETASISP
jgi:uncharacterized membrane protein YozB (DUF420 family)